MEGKASPQFPPNIQSVARRRLEQIKAATTINDLAMVRGNRLHPLKKAPYVGYHSVSINDQWRIVFRWSDNKAFEIEIVDYH